MALTKRSRMAAWLVSTVAILIAGCSNDKQGFDSVRGLSRAESDAMAAQHSKFERSEDPPFTAKTRFAAGQLAEAQGSPRTAVEQYNEALKLDPNHLPSLYRLGVVYAQNGAYPDAIAAWKTYVEKSGGDAGAYSNLGFCYELAGQPADAEAAYKLGVARDGRHVACRTNYGLMLARAGRINEAVIQLQAVLPEAQVHYNLAVVYEQQGHKELAKAEYRRSVDLDPQLVEARNRLAALEQ